MQQTCSHLTFTRIFANDQVIRIKDFKNWDPGVLEPKVEQVTFEVEPEADQKSSSESPLGGVLPEKTPMYTVSSRASQAEDSAGLSIPLSQLLSYEDKEKMHIEVKVYPSDQLEISELILDQLWLREQGLERFISKPQNKPQSLVVDDSAEPRTVWSFSISEREWLRHKELNLIDLL